MRHAHLEFNSSPLKSYRAPKGKDRLPTIIFLGAMLNSGGVVDSVKIYFETDRYEMYRQRHQNIYVYVHTFFNIRYIHRQTFNRNCKLNEQYEYEYLGEQI